MIQSGKRYIRYANMPASLSVMRNDGHCWGRLIVDNKHYDVSSDEDYYDATDEDALDAFEAVLDHGHPRAVRRAIAWLL